MVKPKDKKGRFKKIRVERDIADIINNVGEIINDISLSNITSLYEDELSKKALRLSTMKAFIGQSEAEMEYNLKLMQASNKAERNRIYLKYRRLDEKISQGDCNIYADCAIESLIVKEIEIESLLKKLRNLRKDVGDIITTIQTRIKVLTEERKENNIYTGNRTHERK